MIDAYEIGIQLLLQEDVSAGLAVINRGLAEVDRAIAATSADLVGLTKEAESATRAVAAAVGARTAPAAAIGTTPGAPTEQVAQGQALMAAVTAPSVPFGEETAAPDVKASEPPVPVATPTSPQSRDEPMSPKQDTREQTVSSSAPVSGGTAENVSNDQPANTVQAEAAPSASAAPAQIALAAPRPREPMPQLTKQVAAAAQDTRRSAASPPGQMALTASVGRAHRTEAPTVQPGLVRDKPLADQAARPERPAAPWSGVAQTGSQGEATRLQERAAAPKSASQDRGGSGGGTVMLDGRLVGQWMSEHMAREASRPPAGTSFFDPRQTPAWNVSGAL